MNNEDQQENVDMTEWKKNIMVDKSGTVVGSVYFCECRMIQPIINYDADADIYNCSCGKQSPHLEDICLDLDMMAREELNYEQYLMKKNADK